MLSKITLAARIFLGLCFLIFGINGFWTFIPVPEFHPFMTIMVSTGYIYVVKAVEVAAGLMFLSNRMVAMAAVLSTAIVVNIATYHAMVDQRNWFMPLILAVPLGIVFVDRWPELRPLFLTKRPPK